MKADSYVEVKKNPNIPPFRPGDTVRVHAKVVEGDRQRIQMFEGVVLRIHRSGSSSNFTVRRISHGVGVERVFPYRSPLVEKVEVVRVGRVRRARLYYLRERIGKKARIRAGSRERFEALTSYKPPIEEQVEEAEIAGALEEDAEEVEAVEGADAATEEGAEEAAVEEEPTAEAEVASLEAAEEEPTAEAAVEEPAAEEAPVAEEPVAEEEAPAEEPAATVEPADEERPSEEATAGEAIAEEDSEEKKS